MMAQPTNGRHPEDMLLPQVQAHLLARDVPIPPWDAGKEKQSRFRARVAQGLVEIGAGLRDDRVAPAASRLAEMMTGIGVLTPLLREPGVEEIVVRQGHVQIERRGRFEELGELADDAHFEMVARRAADRGRRAMKADRPYVLVDLPDGSRFTAIIPPLSVSGTAINIRVFRREAMDLEALAEMGAFSPGDSQESAPFIPDDDDPAEPSAVILAFLSHLAATNAATVLFSGEFGSGKTTMMNAASLYLPHTLQVAVVETFEELQLAHPHAARAVVPGERENFPSLAEVVNVVYTRMRPDLMIIGEIVKDEAARFLDAINLGKKAWSTIHGNSALGALYRLETKALTSGLPHRAIREQVAAGVDLVIHLRKSPNGRRYVEQIVAVENELDATGSYQLRTLYDARSGSLSNVDQLLETWKQIRGIIA